MSDFKCNTGPDECYLQELIKPDPVIFGNAMTGTTNENLCDSCRYEQPTCNGIPLLNINTDLVIKCNKYSKEHCMWCNSGGAISEDIDTHWQTSCGEDFMLSEGTPDSNSMNYCCYCGKAIDQLVES